RRVLGEKHPRTASLLCTLSVAALQTGHPQAAALTDEALAVGRVALGDHHPWLVNMLSNAAALRFMDGRREEALPLLREALAICDRNPATSAADRVFVEVNLASMLWETGHFDEA